MKQPAWSTYLYDRQHEIWPGWSRSQGDAARAAAFLERWLELRPGSAVLDIGCGSGRELAALAARGHRATGIDRSPALVERARERLRERGFAARAEVGDALDLRAHAGAGYDLVYLWDSTLNIFEWKVAREVLAAAARCARPGGWLVTQQLHAEYWSQPRPPQRIEDAAVGPGWSERSYRFRGGVLLDEVVYTAAPGAPPERLPVQELALFPLAELEAALRELGCAEIRACGALAFDWERAQAPGGQTPLVAVAGRLPGRAAPVP